MQLVEGQTYLVEFWRAPARYPVRMEAVYRGRRDSNGYVGKRIGESIGDLIFESCVFKVGADHIHSSYSIPHPHVFCVHPAAVYHLSKLEK